jgi:hypothetical protein
MLSPNGSTKTCPSQQGAEFIVAARELGCDEDEARWDERLRRVAKQKPAETPE